MCLGEMSMKQWYTEQIKKRICFLKTFSQFMRKFFPYIREKCVHPAKWNNLPHFKFSLKLKEYFPDLIKIH
jgi:hypothetical protein